MLVIRCWRYHDKIAGLQSKGENSERAVSESLPRLHKGNWNVNFQFWSISILTMEMWRVNEYWAQCFDKPCWQFYHDDCYKNHENHHDNVVSVMKNHEKHHNNVGDCNKNHKKSTMTMWWIVIKIMKITMTMWGIRRVRPPSSKSHQTSTVPVLLYDPG